MKKSINCSIFNITKTVHLLDKYFVGKDINYVMMNMKIKQFIIGCTHNN